MVSPIAEYASAAASRNIPAASMQLKSPHGFGEPISVATIPESVLARAARRSAAFARTARRCAGLVAAQAGKAAAAASTADRASFGLAAGTSQSVFPVIRIQFVEAARPFRRYPLAANEQIQLFHRKLASRDELLDNRLSLIDVKSIVRQAISSGPGIKLITGPRKAARPKPAKPG